MTMNIEKRLETIEARIAISELRSKYCWYTVRGMKHDLVELFTQDGVFQNARNAEEHPVAVKGRQALEDYFSRIKPARRVPLVTNEVLTINGDCAEGTCAMLGVGDDSFCGHYIDTFRKEDGSWLFSARQFFPYWPQYKPDAERQHP
jgi:hypothetical protein